MDKLHITGYSRVEHDLSIPVYHAKLVDIKIKKLQAEIDKLKKENKELKEKYSQMLRELTLRLSQVVRLP